MSEPIVRVIVNPQAGSGRAGRALPEIERELRRHDLSYEVDRTRGPGDAGKLAKKAIDDGVGVIAIVGGDGTINEVSQGFVDGDGRPRAHLPDLALIPAGTGGDLRRTIGLSNDVGDAVRRIREGRPRPLDFGLLRLTGHAGEPLVRAFMNIASFGASGAVDQLVNDAPKWIGGRAAFLVGTARALYKYRNMPVRVKVDGRVVHEGRAYTVAIANGRYFGSGMMVAPAADPSDGRFEVVTLGDLSKAQTLGLGAKIYQGAHIGMDRIGVTSGTVVEAEPLHPWLDVLVDMDGETPGKLPLKAEIVPGALRIRV